MACNAIVALVLATMFLLIFANRLRKPRILYICDISHEKVQFDRLKLIVVFSTQLFCIRTDLSSFPSTQIVFRC